MIRESAKLLFLLKFPDPVVVMSGRAQLRPRLSEWVRKNRINEGNPSLRHTRVCGSQVRATTTPPQAFDCATLAPPPKSPWTLGQVAKRQASFLAQSTHQKAQHRGVNWLNKESRFMDPHFRHHHYHHPRGSIRYTQSKNRLAANNSRQKYVALSLVSLANACKWASELRFCVCVCN